MSTYTALPDAPRTSGSLVNTLAGLLRGSPVLSQGDLAALRRMDPRDPPAAFFKIEALALDPVLPSHAARLKDAETRWAVIVLGLAHLGDLHQPDARLGHALVEAGFSELRFTRLLQADVGQLVDELPLLARYLSAKHVSADWGAAAGLILSAGRPGEEDKRRHLARDYYGKLARQENA